MKTYSNLALILGACALRCIATGLLAALLLAASTLLLEAAASETDAPRYNHPAEVEAGTLLFRNGEGFAGAPVLETDVSMEITGLVARARVRQAFRNPGADWQEGIYVFPLPEDAAVDHLRMQVGERVIEGRIKEREKARREYEKAAADGKRASLVEQERPNIFTTSVANIGPGETIIVEIEYQQQVRYDAGRFSLRFPMVVGPRYIPGNHAVRGFAGSGWGQNTDTVPDARRITPPVRKDGGINPVQISVDLDAGMELRDITSPYHRIRTERGPGTSHTVTLAEETVFADRDFVLEWTPAAGAAPRAALFREAFDGAEYGLLMILPPEAERASPLRREMVFVIDTSGSMGGESIRQARRALELALGRLRAGDTFNLIEFNSSTSQLFLSAVPVSEDTIGRARRWVRGLEANGGTEMAPALRLALQSASGGYDLRQVIFLTDGSVGNEAQLFRIIDDYLGDSRLFTIGIGSAPNGYFMTRAARAGRGTHTYIGNTSEVLGKMEALFGKLESPVLTGIDVRWPDGVPIEAWPQRIPDLYLGEPLTLAFRAEGALPAQLAVRGRTRQSEWNTTASLSGGQERSGIHVLWARRKIAALSLMDTVADEEGAVRKQIIDLALAHHLVSRHTSLVAVDVTPARPANKTMDSRAVPANLPAGWDYEKVFGRMPQTATPASLYLILGALLLLVGLLLPVRCRHA